MRKPYTRKEVESVLEAWNPRTLELYKNGCRPYHQELIFEWMDQHKDPNAVEDLYLRHQGEHFLGIARNMIGKKNYRKALVAYETALKLFNQLDEISSIYGYLLTEYVSPRISECETGISVCKLFSNGNISKLKHRQE